MGENGPKGVKKGGQKVTQKGVILGVLEGGPKRVKKGVIFMFFMSVRWLI